MRQRNGQQKAAAKRCLRTASLVAAILMAVHPGDARADFPDFADIAQNTVTAGATTATAASSAVTATAAASTFIEEQVWQPLRDGWKAAIDSAQKAIEVKVSTMNTDTIDANGKLQTDAKSASEIAVANEAPPSLSACHIGQSGDIAAKSNVSGAALTQALVQGYQNRRNDPVTNAKEIKAECKLGFAPTDPNDPQGQVNIALGCPQGSNSAHVRQDRNIQAVLGPLQYPVPSNYPKPSIKGVYEPYSDIASAGGPNLDYYTFAAALNYCIHTIPPVSQPPQGMKATPGHLSIGAYINLESAVSMGSSACFAAFTRRLQFTPNSPKFPANTPNNTVSPPIVTMYDEQVARCTEDNKLGFIDDTALANCKLYGRSNLQADHDKAYRRASAKWNAEILPTYSVAVQSEKIDAALAAEDNFDHRLELERQTLQEAISQANGFAGSIAQTYSSPLDQPIY